MLMIAVLAFARDGLLAVPAGRAWWIGGAMAAFAGIATARGLVARLARHGVDGLLAADALNPAVRRGFLLRCHAGFLAMGVVIGLLLRPHIVPVLALTYLATAGIATAMGEARGLALPGGPAADRWLRAAQRRVAVGLAGAAIIFCVTLVDGTQDESARIATTAVASLAVAAVLTRVDATAVRFLAMAGHGLPGIALRLAPAALTFSLLAPLAVSMSAGLRAGGVTAAAVAAMLLFMALRIQACRLLGRRQADVVVTVALAIIASAAMISPVAAALVAIGIFWRLSRRARARLWVVA
ncbi:MULTISPECIES: hypothetical protein [unclassified Sphingomonas]|nr:MULTISPECIES: hypothetical protein [unclassified Sphingomonas]